MAILTSFKKNIDSLIAAIAGFIFIQMLTSHSGIGISPDSITYLSGARNLYAGKGWIEFGNHPIVNFPLCYPTFLSGLLWITGKDVLIFAPLLNGFLFAAVIYLSGTIIEHFIQPAKWYKWMLLSIIAFSPSLFEVYSMLWSETLFIFLTILFFISLKYYLNNPSYKFLLFISIITAIAFDTRYAGITLLATGGLLILLEPSIKRGKKIIHIVLFGTISISLVLLNLLRNYHLTGTLAGIRLKSITSFSQNLNYIGIIFCDWLSFLNNQYSFATLVSIILLIVFAVIFIRQSLNKKYSHSYEKILSVFFIVYSLFIAVSSSISRYEAIDNRLLSPAYIPFILVIGYRLPYWQKNISSKKWRMIYATGIIILFTGFQYFQFQTNAENYDDIKDDGVPGYAEDVWKDSPIIQFIQKDTLLAKHAQQTFCNENYALYFFTNYNVENIPEKAHLKEIEEFNQTSGYYLVWFLTDENPDLIALDEIKKHVTLTTLHQFPDGYIFYCSKKK